MDIKTLAGKYLNGRALEVFVMWYKIYRKDLLETGKNRQIENIDEINIKDSISKFIIENGGRLVMRINDLDFRLNTIKPKDESWLHIVNIFNDKFNQSNS